MKILAINPGGTSTKIALFEDTKELYSTSFIHSVGDLRPFTSVFDEFPYRLKLIEGALEKAGHDLNTLDGIVGRGGLMKPLSGGTYHINEAMLNDLQNTINGEHASNLGAFLAKHLGDAIGKPSFVVDPVTVDEFDDISRISGIHDLEYTSWLHALNHKAVCRHVATDMGGAYEDFNFIVAHLGSGITIVPHHKGRMVDSSGGRSNGPFSPERSGGLPTYQLIQLCYSGKYTYEEMVRKVSFEGGLYDYLGTKNVHEVEERAAAGDSKAQLILDAFIYQICKDIAMFGATLCGKVDRIILTGGIAYSTLLQKEVERRVGYLAPIVVMAGEMELEAMALGVWRVLSGQEKALEYGDEAGPKKK